MVDDFVEVTEREPSEQIAGRFVGMVVFLAGIAILVVTFALAYQAFQNPNTIISTRDFTGPVTTSPTVPLIHVVLRFLLLIAMGYLGSLIAGRGAQFFFSARKEVRRVSPGD